MIGKEVIEGEVGEEFPGTPRQAKEEIEAGVVEPAVEALARLTYEEMGHLYPDTGSIQATWEELTIQDRNFYRDCVAAILEQKALVIAALGISDTDPTIA